MLAEGSNGAMIIGFIILIPLLLGIVGWIYALVRGTARTARYYATKDPETKRKIEEQTKRGLEERGYRVQESYHPEEVARQEEERREEWAARREADWAEREKHIAQANEYNKEHHKNQHLEWVVSPDGYSASFQWVDNDDEHTES